MELKIYNLSILTYKAHRIQRSWTGKKSLTTSFCNFFHSVIFLKDDITSLFANYFIIFNNIFNNFLKIFSFDVKLVCIIIILTYFINIFYIFCLLTALNASRGIASLCLAYFNYEDLPASLIHNLDLSYFEEAMEYLLSHPKVISDHCGVVANCFGGCLGYRMALHFNELKAVFLINTTHNPFFGKFKYKGKVVAECPGVGAKEIAIREDDNGFYLPTESYNKAIATVAHSDIEAFENTDDDQHFVIAIGEEDCYQLQNGWLKFQERLSDKKRRNLSLKIYPKAGHIIHTPYSPFPSIVSSQLLPKDQQEGKRILVKFGGQPKETVFMQEDVWKLIPDFIHKHITNKN